MNRILSQEEIDALLATVIDDDPEEAWGEADPIAGRTRRPAPPASKDKKEFEDSSRSPSVLEAVHAAFCKAAGPTFAEALGRDVRLTPAGITLMRFQKLLARMSAPSCLAIFQIDSLPGNGVLAIEKNLALALSEIATGRDRKIDGARDAGNPAKDFEALRDTIVKSLWDLEGAFWSYSPLDMEFLCLETNPQLLALTPPTEVVVCLRSVMDVEGIIGDVTVVIPYATVGPIREGLRREKAKQRENEAEAPWKKETLDIALETTVEVRAVLGFAQLSIRRILALKPGETVMLDRHADAPIDLFVEDKKKFQGRTVASHDRIAFSII